MTEAEKIKAQIAILERVIEVAKWRGSLRTAIDDELPRMRFELRRLMRQATAANPLDGSQQGTLQPSGAVPA